ncbi:MAG: lamin tail domain-containing protein, partial [Bacteroidetes bacterium]|nr:lamin tail domain-containing protein [Bacteroidota bacterium]
MYQCIAYRISSLYIYKIIIYSFLFLCISFPTIAQVVINELRIYPANNKNNIGNLTTSGTGDGSEYLELYNKSNCDVDISCWFLAGSNYVSGSTGGSELSNWTLRFPQGTIIPANSFLVVAGDGVTNVPSGIRVLRPNQLRSGNQYDINIFLSLTNMPWLQNGSDWKAVYDASGEPVDAVAWGFANENINIISTKNEYSRQPQVINRTGCPFVTALSSIRAIFQNASTSSKLSFLNGAESQGVWERTFDGASTWAFVSDPANATPGSCNGSCNVITPITATGITICAGAPGNITASNLIQIAQNPLIVSSTATGQAEGIAFGGAVTVNVPALPAGAIVNRIITSITGSRNCGDLNQVQVRGTPPAAVGSPATFDLVGVAPAQLTNQVFGNWNPVNPSGVWTFDFRKITNCFSSIDITNIVITVKVEYSFSDQAVWFTAATGGILLGSGNPFNPVGKPGSGLPDTNTPGTYSFYAASASNPTCRAKADFIIKKKEKPVIACGTKTLSSIRFDWAAVPLATSYEIKFSVNGGAFAAAGTTTNLFYQLNGLQPGTNVALSVTPKGGVGTCFDSETITCRTASCSLVLTSATGTDAQTICEGQSINVIEYTFGGDATDVTITGIPGSGITITRSGKKVTISGNPANSFNFSVSTVGCINNETKNGAILVNPKPTVLVNSSTICSGAAATIIATPGAGAVNDYDYQWTIPAGASSPGNTANFSTATPGIYSVVVKRKTTGCLSASAAGNVSVNSLPSIPGVTLITPICSGANAVFTINGTAGLTVNYKLNGVAGATVIGGGGTVNVTVTAASANQELILTDVTNGVCSNNFPDITRTIIVNPLPTVPTITATSICSGANAIFTINGIPNLKVNYTLNGVNGSTIIGSTGSENITVISATVNQTLIATDATNGTCPINFADITRTITVNPIPPVPSISAVDCSLGFGQGRFTVTGPTPVSNYVFSINGGSSYQATPVFSSLANNTYSLIAKDNVTGCVSRPLTPIRVTCGCLIPPTVTLPATGANICPAASYTINNIDFGGSATRVTVTHNGTGSITLSNGSGNVATTKPFNVTYNPGSGEANKTVVITFTTDVASGSFCSPDVVSFDLVVEPVTPLPGVDAVPIEYCKNETAVALTAVGASLKWYPTATSSTGTTTAYVPSTTTVGTQEYFVTQTLNGCESEKARIQVVVNEIPAAPIVNPVETFCLSATVSPLTANGNNLLWYNILIGGGSGDPNAPIPSTANAGSTDYFVSQTVNGCESPRATITVNIIGKPSPPVVTSPLEYCINEPITQVPATAATGTGLLWYTQASGGGAGDPNPPAISTASEGTTDYYVTQSPGSCGESDRAKITVIIKKPTTTLTAPSNSSVFVCIDSLMEVVTFVTTGASGIAGDGDASGVNGLPPGVSANFLNDVIMLRGTPTLTGVFTYSIPVNSGCGSLNAGGTITVEALRTVTVGSGATELCINDPVGVNITH